MPLQTTQRLFCTGCIMNKNSNKKNYKKTTAAAKKNKHTALHATLFAIVAVLLILVLMVVELRPVKSVSGWGGPEESLALASVAGKVFASLNQSDRRKEFLSLTLSHAETRALLTMALRAHAVEKKADAPLVYAEWNTDGSLNAECSIKFAGMYFNFYTQLIPAVSSGKVYLQINKCRIGKLPLPAGMVEKIVNSRLQQEISKDKRLHRTLSLIDTLQAEKNGEIQLKVLRKNSGKLLKSIF